MASSGNFATLNPLIKSSTNTFSNGHCRITSSSGGWGSPLTLAANTGKFYVEINFVVSDTNGGRIAVLPTNSAKYNDGDQSAAGAGEYAIEWKYDGDSNFITNNGSTTQSNVGSWAQGDVAAVAFDLDASPKTVQFYKNNSTIGSAENINTSAIGPFTVMIYAHNAGTWHINAGQDSTFGGNETAGGNADGNGFGDFYYSPPSGFLALSSANLPVSDDIDPAQTDDDFPQKQFNAITWTGNRSSNSTVNNITGVGFQPDLVWLKFTEQAYDWRLVDSSRGVTEAIRSNQTTVEQTEANGLYQFGSDGFSVKGDNNYNYNGGKFIGYCWRANGGTTSSNTDGSITSTVQANTAAGFSIVTYTGTESGATVGHGLGAVPKWIIVKNRSSTKNWACYHVDDNNSGTRAILLNTGGVDNASSYWNSTQPTSSVFSIGGATEVNESSSNIVAYCWADVEGFQKFGTYTGNGNSDGPFVYLGFRPRLLVLKRTTSSGQFNVFDSARSTFNPVDKYLGWNVTDAEATGADVDFLSNGFKVRNTGSGVNTSGTKYIYMAWGDVPFKYNNTF